METPTRRLATGVLAATAEELRQYLPFDRMEAAHLHAMVACLELVYFPPDSTVLSPASGASNALHIVKQGAVLGFDDADAQTERWRWRLEAGECFPLGALIGGRAVTSLYRAAGDLFCYRLPKAAFDDLLRDSAAFRDFATQRLAAMLVASQRSRQHAVADTREQPLARSLAQVLAPRNVVVSAVTPVRAVLEAMRDAGTDAALVADDGGAALGIFTLRDLRDRVVLGGGDSASPVGLVMTPGPATLDEGARAFEAALLMAERGFRHVVVTGRGRALGIVTEAEVLSSPQLGITAASAAIRRAGTRPALQMAADGIRILARELGQQGMDAETLTRLIATLNDQLSQRVVERAAAAAQVPLDAFCWLSFGSEGRREQTFATDQDNGLVFDAPPGGETPASWRQRMLGLAQQANDELAACGFALCKGEVMAGNPRWCLSLGEWKTRFGDWLRTPDAEALLNASIFFDLRPVAGNLALGSALAEWLAGTAREHAVFLRLLAENALSREVPLGVVRDFVTGEHDGHEGTLDLKTGGTAIFADAARVLGLAVGQQGVGTAERLRTAAIGRGLDSAEVSGWLDAFHFIQQTRIEHQLACLAKNRPPDNFVAPEALNALDRRILRESLRQARKVQERLRLDYRL